jgi:hypothetical protein
MPLILGVAFRFHHYSCHAAHSTCFGENPALERARADLAGCDAPRGGSQGKEPKRSNAA